MTQELNSEEQSIHDRAVEYARANKKRIAKELSNPERFPPEDNPVSVFMAGSPGAGKTEASKALIDKYTDGVSVLRIDADELRELFEEYAGGNSHLFQGGTSILVDKIHDTALDHKQSFLLDGTLTDYKRAERNIERSLKRDRLVQILYVYQEPGLAWDFVQARETEEGRRILLEDFIHQYFAARNVVNRLKDRFSGNIKVDLLIKNHDGSDRLYKANIDKIDNHVPEKYTPASLAKLLDPS
ncbi:MAG TPA: zeta toxin family protein [Gammaproteobacteria bacterium]